MEMPESTRRTTLYKVVETQVVTDDVLEGILNEWTALGWVLDGINFAMRESSRRPAMAFVVFTRQVETPEEEEEEQEEEQENGGNSTEARGE